MTLELPSVEVGVSARWRPGHLAALAIAVGLGLWLGWQERLPEVSTGGDEAIYVALSHSLAQGHYRDEFLVGTPPHAKYPPGNPAWLLVLRTVAGPDLDRARFANLLLLAIAALLTGDAVRRLASPWAGVGATAAVILNPGLLRVSGTVLSEAPYIAWITLSAWAYLRGEGAVGRRWELVGYAAALVAFLTRPIGLAALGAITLTYLVRRRWRAAAAAGAGALIAAGGWSVYATWASHRTIGETYTGELAARIEEMSFAVGPWLTALHRGFRYLRVLPARYALPTIEGTPIDNIVWYLLLFGCGGIGLWVLARRWPVLVLTLAGSFLVLAAWVWGIDRLILPLLPGGIALLMVGADAIGRPRGSRAALAAVGSLTALLGVSALVQHGASIGRPGCVRMSSPGPSPCFGEREARLVAVARLADQAVPSDAVIATSKPATVFYFGRRQALPLGVLVSRVRRDPSRSLASFGSTHIILGEVVKSDWKVVAPILYLHCGSLGVVAELPPATVLLSLREAGSSGGEACRYLESRLRAFNWGVEGAGSTAPGRHQAVRE